MTIALIDFFREISQSFDNKEKLFFVDITNYICNVRVVIIQKILEKRNEANEIDSKHVTQYRTIEPNFKIRDFLIDPPKLYGSKDEMVYKLSASKIKVDKAKHQSVVTKYILSYKVPTFPTQLRRFLHWMPSPTPFRSIILTVLSSRRSGQVSLSSRKTL